MLIKSFNDLYEEAGLSGNHKNTPELIKKVRDEAFLPHVPLTITETTTGVLLKVAQKPNPHSTHLDFPFESDKFWLAIDDMVEDYAEYDYDDDEYFDDPDFEDDLDGWLDDDTEDW